MKKKEKKIPCGLPTNKMAPNATWYPTHPFPLPHCGLCDQ